MTPEEARLHTLHPLKADDAGNGAAGAQHSTCPAPSQAIENISDPASLSGHCQDSEPIHAVRTKPGKRTASERAGLDALPLGKQCRRCNKTVFVLGNQCPTCGGWLTENDQRVTTGKYSAKALRRDREAILETWRSKYRGPDGSVSAPVDSVLRQLSRLEAISNRCVRWSESTSEPVTSTKHGAVIKMLQGAADRLARLHIVLMQLTSDGSAPSPAAFQVPALRIEHVEYGAVMPYVTPEVIEAEVETRPTTWLAPAAASPQPAPASVEPAAPVQAQAESRSVGGYTSEGWVDAGEAWVNSADGWVKVRTRQRSGT